MESEAMTSPRLRLCVSLTFVVALGVGAPAQPQAPVRAVALDEAVPFDAAVRTTTLPNGMRVFIRRNERPARRVALRLAVKAGSIDEADDQQGLAHLVEHMAFNGTAQ